MQGEYGNYSDLLLISSVIITSHWEISFWLAWLISCTCTEGASLIFSAITSIDIPSNKVEIPIHIHARVLASLLSDTAIIIASANRSPHNHIINHHRGCCPLLFIQYITNIIHLAKAQRANTHIIIVHTSWEYEKINQNQSNANKNHPIQSNQTNELSLFLNALIIAEIPEVNKKNPNTISINFQNTPGAHIVIIQKIITTIANPIIKECGQACTCLFSSMNLLIYQK